MDLGLAGQPSRISPRSSLGEPVLVVLCPRREELRTWISLLETRHWLPRVDLVMKKKWDGFDSKLTRVGYGIHYPVRHGQVENWVRFSKLCAGDTPPNIRRITWNASGPTRSLNTSASNRKTTTSYSRNLYVPSSCSQVSPLTVYSH